MKATFEFDFNEPEDVMEHRRMSHALGMAMVLWEFTYNGKKRMENLIDNNTLSAQETLDAVYNMFHELMEHDGINIEKLIN